MAYTIVFEGDIRKLGANPMKVDSAFGKVIACGVGNAFDKIEHLIDVEEAAQVLLEAIKKNLDADDDQ